MQLWAAALLFVLFAAAAFSFLKGGRNKSGIRFYTGILFAFIGGVALAYIAATVFFVVSIE
ncbi:MAG TPA: hypothetical protein PK849_02585 [Synergistales bacterium]|nr:hypothetical protein [Synergistaceae bacterium]HOO88394.1 hypothetical protein [Synergistales bacterium]HPE65041.1 hypothetical protein [Synergistales bacterium]